MEETIVGAFGKGEEENITKGDKKGSNFYYIRKRWS